MNFILYTFYLYCLCFSIAALFSRRDESITLKIWNFQSAVPSSLPALFTKLLLISIDYWYTLFCALCQFFHVIRGSALHTTVSALRVYYFSDFNLASRMIMTDIY